MGNVLDTVDDHPRIIEKNDIAVFAHDLYDQLHRLQISHLVQMFDGDLNDPLHARLSDPGDPSVADMFPEKHTEVRRGQRIGFIIRNEINKGQAGACREQKPVRFFLILYDQQQLVRLRLIDFIDAAAREQTIHIIYNIGNDNSVKSHIYSSSKNCGAGYISCEIYRPAVHFLKILPKGKNPYVL